MSIILSVNDLQDIIALFNPCRQPHLVRQDLVV